jgi:hypothetical protein
MENPPVSEGSNIQIVPGQISEQLANEMIVPEHIVNTSNPKSKHPFLIIIGILLLVVIIFLIGVFVVYGEGKTKLGQDFQNKIWVNIIDGYSTLQPVDGSGSVVYQDTGTFNFVPSTIIKQFEPTTSPEDLKSADDAYSFTLSNLKLSSTSSAYVNFTDSKNPKADVAIQEAFDNNNQSYTGNLGFKLQGKSAFALYNYNQALQDSALAKIITMYGGNLDQSKNTWLKLTDQLNLDDYLKQVNNPTSADKELLTTLKNNRLFDIKAFRGISYVNGHMVWHYQLALNKVNLKNIYEDGLSTSLVSLPDADKQDYMQFVDTLLSKFEIKNFDIWIGVSDHKVYKVNYTSNAPSITQTLNLLDQSLTTGDAFKLITNDLSSTQNNSRDVQRVADIHQLATALYKYYNVNAGYPDANNGVPIGISPYYMNGNLVAPLPVDGNCNDFYNNYWYTPEGSPINTTDSTGQKVVFYPSYQISFCLGAATESISSGVNLISPAGIQSDPADTAKLVKPKSSQVSPSTNSSTQQITDLISNFVKNLSFDATITIDENIKSYTSNRSVQLPTDYKDISVLQPDMPINNMK